MNTTTDVEVIESRSLPRFRTVLFSVLAVYAAARCASFALPLLIGGRGAAIPAAIESTFSLQVWAVLWGAGALLHVFAIRWEWAATATLWTFSIKGLAVAAAFLWSAIADGGSIPASFGGVVSYGFPVLMVWLVHWALALRSTTLVQLIPTVEASTVTHAARERLRAETGEIPEVPHG